MKSKLWIVVLTLCMALTLLTAPALAAGEACPGGDGCDHAAAVGDNHYQTVADALEEAGGEVTLLKNAELEASVAVPEGATIDLNGFTLTVTARGRIIQTSTGPWPPCRCPRRGTRPRMIRNILRRIQSGTARGSIW